MRYVFWLLTKHLLLKILVAYKINSQNTIMFKLYYFLNIFQQLLFYIYIFYQTLLFIFFFFIKKSHVYFLKSTKAEHRTCKCTLVGIDICLVKVSSCWQSSLSTTNCSPSYGIGSPLTWNN